MQVWMEEFSNKVAHLPLQEVHRVLLLAMYMRR